MSSTICRPACAPTSPRHEDNPNFRFDEADVLTWDRLERVVGWADRIYHLAAVVGVYRVLAEPTKVLATNIAGCERLLRAAHAGGWKPQVVLASSSEVYGHNDEDILREDQDLVGQHARRHALGLLGEQDRRRGAGHVLRAALRHPGGDRALLQHRRPAPGRALRHGRAALRRAGGARRAASPCSAAARRRVRSATCATPSSRSTRWPSRAAPRHAGRQRRQRPRDQHRRTGRAGDRSAPAAARTSSTCRCAKPTARTSRTSAAAGPSLARLRSLTGFEHHYTLEQTIDDLIADRTPRDSKRQAMATAPWFVTQSERAA